MESSPCLAMPAAICFSLFSKRTREIGVCMISGLLLFGCSEHQAPPAPKVTAAEVTAITVSQSNAPIAMEFVAQTQSSHEVEIRARVEGFLEKRMYTEGQPVRAGQVLFLMDRKPFEAALLSAQGQLEQQKARLVVARQHLTRVRPLVAQNAVSQKDLDDAVGNEQQARAAVLAAEGEVRAARLNLSYTTISSPINGLAGYAKKDEGSYVTPGESGFLTSVSKVNPMWINFSVSENELLKYRSEIDKGQLKFPPNGNFDVQVVLADGTIYPSHGRINFISPTFSKDTGTFLVRTEMANPDSKLRPGQFVRALVRGAERPNATLVPQRAVLQGAKGHYVWVIDKEGKARERAVEVGGWQGDNWFVNRGLSPGERIVVDGAIRVAAGSPLKIAGQPSTRLAESESAGTAPSSEGGSSGTSTAGSGTAEAGQPADAKPQSTSQSKPQ